MQCIICEKSLSTIVPDDIAGKPNLQPAGATMWQSHGNYGSEIFDSIFETETLILHICDDCLWKHAHKMHAFQGNQPAPIAEVIDLT